MSNLEEIKLTGESKDIVSENISKLKEIFPDIFTEDKIDFDKLKYNLGEYVDDSPEKYSFTWSGKTQAIKESQKQSTGTLRPCREESKNWDTTQNIYIEGDNLEVLKLLQKTYYNRIKAIYIDPPYNTGKDFVYPDDYTDNLDNYLKITGQIVDLENNDYNIRLTNNLETNGRYHSNWLNMMYPRLKLSKNLLKDDGIIFISIDDNESDNLKKLCDEIFGEYNFIAKICRTASAGSKNDAKYFITDNDYILVYAKNKDLIEINKIKKKNTQKYPKKDSIGEFKLRALEMQGGGEDKLENRPKLGYSIYFNPVSNDFKLLHDYNLDNNPVYDEPCQKYIDNGYICIRPRMRSNNTVHGRWKWSKEKFLENLSEIYIDVNKKRAFTKDRKKEFLEISPNCNIQFLNTEGTNEITSLFNQTIFDFPKPAKLIEYLFNLIPDENDIYLDFFSGSATTAQAIFNKNLHNNSSSSFILVQIPEKTDEKSTAYKEGYKTICEIGKERIRRAGDKILRESNNTNLDIGFKVFKLDSSNLEKWDPDYNNIQQSLMVDNIKPDRTNDDLIYEIMLKYGMDLTWPIQKENNIYSIGFGALIVCLEDNITKEITEKILDLTKNSSISRVVFKDNGFISDAEKTNIKEILKVNKINEFITI